MAFVIASKQLRFEKQIECSKLAKKLVKREMKDN